MILPKIDSPDAGRFRDRFEAGQRLALALRAHAGERPLVLGIPRGGMVPAEVVARELGGELDVALVRKLRSPDRSQLAMGSVAENGLIFLNEGWENLTTNSYLKMEAADALSHLRERRRRYTPAGPAGSAAGRTAIVVDDGVATGATLLAALKALQGSAARQVIAAVAVAPRDLMNTLRREADEVVCLATPEPFFAVSPFFQDFAEVTDDEVVDLLRKAPRYPVPQGRAG